MEDPRLFESFSKYGASTVNNRMHDPAKQQEHTYDLNGLRALAGDAPLLAFEEFNEVEYPTNQQLQYIIRTSHAVSDIVTVPLVSRLTDKLPPAGGYERYEAFVKRALATIDTYNRKPVMGVVPLRLPFTGFEPLLKLYHKNGIGALCLDFAGSSPSTVRINLEQVLFSLASLGILQETYLHAINVNPGRPKARQPVSPDRSIVSFGYDVDSYGDLHRVRTKMEGPPPKPAPVRLFSRRDYGDHVVEAGGDLRAVRPERTGVDLAQACESKDLAKLFNSEQHSFEASSLPQLLKSAKGTKTLELYLTGKRHFEKSTLKQMKGLRSKLRQSKLG